MAEGFMRKAIVPLPMADLNLQLEVDNCPHCGTAKPTLALPMIYGQQGQGIVHSQDYTSKNRFMWLTYICSTCGKGVLAGAKTKPDNAQEHVGYSPLLELYLKTFLTRRATTFCRRSEALAHLTLNAHRNGPTSAHGIDPVSAHGFVINRSRPADIRPAS